MQEILEPALRNLAFDERNQIRLVSEDAAYSFLLGALTAGLMEGPGTVRTELGRMRVDSSIDRAYGAMGEHGLFSPQAGEAVQRTNRVLELPIFGSSGGRRASPLHITPDGVVMMPGAPGQNKTASMGEAGELNPISASMESSLSTEKNNIVAKTMNDIVSFVKTALAKRGGPERLYMGTIPESTASFIKSSTGMDVAGYAAILPGSSVQHIFNRHGDEKTEAARGQRAVSADDVAMIPQVLAAPDFVRLSNDADNLGRPVLLFSKQIGDNIVTAQAVTDGRRALTTNSIWVQKKKNPLVTTSDANATIDPAHNAQSVPPSGSSFKVTIPQNGGSVKGEDGPRVQGLPMAGEEWIDTFVPWPYNEEKGGTQHGGEEAADVREVYGNDVRSEASRTDSGGGRASQTLGGGISEERKAAGWARGHLVRQPLNQAAKQAGYYIPDVFVVEDIALKRRNPEALALTNRGVIYLSDVIPSDLMNVVGYHEVVHAVKQRGNIEYQVFLDGVGSRLNFRSKPITKVLDTILRSRFGDKSLFELSDGELKTAYDELNAVIWGYHKADSENARAQFAEVFTDYDAYISELDAIMERVRRQRAGGPAVPDRRDKAIEEGFADEKPPDARSEEDIDRAWEAAIADAEAQGQESLLSTVIKNGQIRLEDVRANPSVFEGETAQDIAKVLRAQGYKVRIERSRREGSAARIIKIDNLSRGRNISQVQISPGGRRHGPNPYIKISTSDQGTIKIVFGDPETYITDGTETATIIFAGGEWYD